MSSTLVVQSTKINCNFRNLLIIYLAWLINRRLLSNDYPNKLNELEKKVNDILNKFTIHYDEIYEDSCNNIFYLNFVKHCI